jgi:hypothetical protein
MLLDHVIPKPPSIKGYDLHRLVTGLTDGEPSLFADMGDKFIVRTEKRLTDEGTPPRSILVGGLAGFELRACVARKIKGRHIYYPTADWRSRHEWLHKQGNRHGFEPLTINCQATLARIDDGKTKSYTVDQTDFVGVLRVLDKIKFEIAVATGVGSTAKTFGFGMLVI